MRPSRTAPLSPSEPSTSITIPHRRQMPDRHTNTTNNANHCHTSTTTHITNTCNKRHQGRSHVQSAAPTHLVSYKTRMQTKKVKHPHSLLGQATSSRHTKQRGERADTSLMVVVLKNTWFYRYRQRKQKKIQLRQRHRHRSTSLVEAVNGSALTLEGVDHIESGHRLPPRVFRVGHGVFHHILQKGLDHRSGFLIDLARDSLHSAPPRQTADGRLGDTGEILTSVLGWSPHRNRCIPMSPVF